MLQNQEAIVVLNELNALIWLVKNSWKSAEDFTAPLAEEKKKQPEKTYRDNYKQENMNMNRKLFFYIMDLIMKKKNNMPAFCLCLIWSQHFLVRLVERRAEVCPG